MSLLAWRTPDFDPTAWLIWGRQLGEGTLHTVGGPSWKPLPVLFTTPFGLVGDDQVAADLWLVVARAGGLLAVLFCFRVTARLGGRGAGLIAAAGLALATGFAYDAFRGDAEGLLVLCALAGVEAALAGRGRLALVLFAGAGLVRPETWPLIAAWGGWLVWGGGAAGPGAATGATGAAATRATGTAPTRSATGAAPARSAAGATGATPTRAAAGATGTAPTRAAAGAAGATPMRSAAGAPAARGAGSLVATGALVAAVGVVLLAAWVLPEHASSGEWFGAASRAQHPAPGTPGASAFPFGFALLNVFAAVTWPLLAGAAVLVWRTRRPVLRVLAGAAGFQTLLVAVMAQAGFTGNLRYLALPAALVCVLGGVGLAEYAAKVPWGRAVGALAAVGVVVSGVLLAGDVGRLTERQRIYGEELPELIASTGGRSALLRCGVVGANHFARQAVAWRLHLLQSDVRLGTQVANGTVFALQGTGAAAWPTPQVVRQNGAWLLKQHCPQ